MIESRLNKEVKKEEVKAYNEAQEWYAFKRDGTMVKGKLKELRNYGCENTE
jgi:hypothetical protein